MKKISTLYKKNPENLGRVINWVNPENAWVFTDQGIKATRKYDGTAAAVINGELYKRYDVKKGREVPEGAIPCQEPDEITGHHPHWVRCYRGVAEDKYFNEAFDNLHKSERIDGTYELIGEKVNGNRENIQGHQLVKHGATVLPAIEVMNFDALRDFLNFMPIEGIVFYHPDGRMCKLRKSDYGIKRRNHKTLLK